MPNILNYSMQISLYYRLIAYCTLLILNTYPTLFSILEKAPKKIVLFSPSAQKQLKYKLQNWAYTEKPFQYTFNIQYSSSSIGHYTLKLLTGNLNIKKSNKKLIKAHKQCLSGLLFSMISSLYKDISSKNHIQ